MIVTPTKEDPRHVVLDECDWRVLMEASRKLERLGEQRLATRLGMIAAGYRLASPRGNGRSTS
jgi:hypothetical protein